MAATYTFITEAEMDEFMFGFGFETMKVPPIKGRPVKEKVYGKRLDIHGLQLTLRVYSSVERGGVRRVAKDAIYCQLVYRGIKEEPDPTGVYEAVEVSYLFEIGWSVRVHRTQGWKENLADRIDRWKEMMGPPCPGCGSPMLVRENKRDGSEFYGCSTYKEGWCKVTRPITYNPREMTR